MTTHTASPGVSPVRFHSGTLAMAAAALAVSAPIAAVFAGALGADSTGALAHLLSVNGLTYLRTSIILCALAGAGAALIGAGAAMIVSLAEFPGRRLMTVLLALPFAIPAYVAAYAYGDLFGPFGALAGLVGMKALPEIRSVPGAAFVLALMTYPYVYLAMTASLASRSGALMEAARALGASPMRAAFGVLFATARPAFAGGLALALMEIAADYGVADYFGAPTLSVGIFRTWHGLGDLAAAMQIAAALFLFILLFVLIEAASRRGRAHEDARALRAGRRIRLSPLHASLALAACAMPVAFGFIAPVGVLAAKLSTGVSPYAMAALSAASVNTASVAIAGALICLILALALAYGARGAKSAMAKLLLRAATLGYAAPGAVMAIGVIALAAAMPKTSGLAAAGGIGVLLYAYVARFLTAGYNASSAGLAQISPQMDAAAKTLGAGSSRIISAVHLPLAWRAIAAGAAIVAIDIAKELPATLILRPFNFETLATLVYRLASDERLADAAAPALILIGLGLAPALALTKVSASAMRD
ncbi:MAG: iron ABC transporter permease [Parvularculaceae bacterium]